MSIIVRSSAFEPGQRIPTRYCREGKNHSPPIEFINVPSESQELVVIAEDPDAPFFEPWVHWIIYKIPADVDRLPEGIAASPRPGQPDGALQGVNTAGGVGYEGPAPPKGHGTHRYYFKVYALGRSVDLEPGADKSTLLAAIENQVIDQGELVGTYER